jgi:photosystem II stability/assembly factor-like uncharacterized protein
MPYYSTDDGITWNQGTFNGAKARWEAVAGNADLSVLYAYPQTFNGEVYGDLLKSTDGGVSWTSLQAALPSMGMRGFLLSRDGNRIIWPSSGAVHYSANGGTSFTAAATNPSGVGSIMSSMSSDGMVAMLYVNSTNVSVTIDGGAHWTDRTISGITSGMRNEVQPDGARLYVVGTTNKIAYSDNNGLNWSTLSTPVQFYDIAIAASNNNLIYASSPAGYAYKSTDRGLTWTQLNDNNTKFMERIKTSDDGRVIVGTATGYVMSSVDSGATWSKVSVTDYCDNTLSPSEIALSATGDKVYVSCYYGDLISSKP